MEDKPIPPIKRNEEQFQQLGPWGAGCLSSVVGVVLWIVLVLASAKLMDKSAGALDAGASYDVIFFFIYAVSAFPVVVGATVFAGLAIFKRRKEKPPR